jgi:hypothetical protein
MNDSYGSMNGSHPVIIKLDISTFALSWTKSHCSNGKIESKQLCVLVHSINQHPERGISQRFPLKIPKDCNLLILVRGGVMPWKSIILYMHNVLHI